MFIINYLNKESKEQFNQYQTKHQYPAKLWQNIFRGTTIYGWLLDRVQTIDPPIPYKGKLGLFNIDININQFNKNKTKGTNNAKIWKKIKGKI